MTSQTVLDIATETIIVSMKIGAPALITIMLTGLIVSIFQAATQINEQTLAFIPKVITMSIVLVITGPWILQVLIIFTKEIFLKLPTVTQ